MDCLKPYLTEKYLNPYMRVRSNKPIVLSVAIETTCVLWVFFYSFMMNFVNTYDCWAVYDSGSSSWSPAAAQ